MQIFEIIQADQTRYQDNDIAAAIIELGLSASGVEARAVLRPCLLGKPRISGYVGPLYGGKRNGFDVIRYEEASVYASMGD